MALLETARTTGETPANIPEAFVYNCWYVAAFAAEITRTPLRRVILGEPVVFYRLENGTIAALFDRCPHRSYPLSRGTLEGDILVCGYHGFSFDPCGTCVSVPGQTQIPRAANVRNYEVVESGPFVWMWAGDNAKADRAKIPEHPWPGEPGWVTFTNSATVACRYGLLLDNLLDLSHETYIHRATIGTPDVAATPIVTEVDGLTVRISRRMIAAECPPFYSKSTGITGRIDRSQDIAFFTPSFYVLSVRVAPTGDTGPGNNAKIMYAITPQTRRSTHDFWAISRDFAVDQEWVTETMSRVQDQIAAEDVAALEALEASLPDGYVPEVSINIDRGALQGRRLIRELLRAQT
ncbi:MAG: aromatic ring-hydroxylating dioxygenase subunit alpha [Candidatus Eremiobacteraeota bacterium]|nr:aromatic ring-hydroxylating dioxygenase subunit alpha [Candidatus Eremiobacteraeota bacterium]